MILGNSVALAVALQSLNLTLNPTIGVGPAPARPALESPQAAQPSGARSQFGF